MSPPQEKCPLCNTISKVHLFSEKKKKKKFKHADIIVLSVTSRNLIYATLKIKLRNKNKQNPTIEAKGEPLAMKRSWRYWDLNFMVWLLIKKVESETAIINLTCYTISWFFWYIKTFTCRQDICTVLDLIPFVIIHKMNWMWKIRAFCSSLLCAIIARNHLPIFKIFSNIVHFCSYFQIFCPL